MKYAFLKIYFGVAILMESVMAMLLTFQGNFSLLLALVIQWVIILGALIIYWLNFKSRRLEKQGE